jgi:hypothetical protein
MNWKGFERKWPWPKLKVLSRHLSPGTKESHEKPHSRDSVFWPRFEACISRIQVRSFTTSANFHCSFFLRTTCTHALSQKNWGHLTKKISVALARERTMPTERPPHVGEVSANFCRQRMSHGQRNGSPRPYSRFSRPEPLLFHSSSSSIVLTRLSGPCSRSTTSQKIW